MPHWESSRLLMKLSLFSDMRLVKQKNVSASACSRRQRRKNGLRVCSASRQFKKSAPTPTFPLTVWVRGKRVVNGSYDLVHALHVGYARVEFGVDEQDALHHLPVRLPPTGQHLVFIGGIQVERLSWWAHLENRGTARLNGGKYTVINRLTESLYTENSNF